MAHQQLSTNTFTVAKWVVSPDPTQGTHTTIQSAINAASSGDTIFIRDGTYAEGGTLTLQPGINLATFPLYSTSSVTITANCNFSGSGSVFITGITFTTNNDFFLSLSGANSSYVYFQNCQFLVTNHAGINFTSTNASSGIIFLYCVSTINAIALPFFSSTSPGLISIINCFLSASNTGSSTVSSGLLNVSNSSIGFPITTSGTGYVQAYSSLFDTSRQGVVSINITGTGQLSQIYQSIITAAAATAISIGAGATLKLAQADVGSSNVTAIGGTGNLQKGIITFFDASSTISGSLTITTFVTV